MTEFKCLKAVFIFNFFRSLLIYKIKIVMMEACALNNLYFILQKTMSSRKSEEDVMIKSCKS